MSMDKKQWTERHETFCVEYIKHGNATEAWRKAHPSSKAKDKTANEYASRLLADGKIRARIEALRGKTAEKYELTLERWDKEVARLAFFDPRRICHEDGRPKMLHELDDDIAAAIKSVEVGVDGIKYTFHDKGVNIGHGGKRLGAYERDNKQKGEPINALAAAVLGGVVGVTFDQDDDEGDDE